MVQQSLSGNISQALETQYLNARDDEKECRKCLVPSRAEPRLLVLLGKQRLGERGRG